MTLLALRGRLSCNKVVAEKGIALLALRNGLSCSRVVAKRGTALQALGNWLSCEEVKATMVMERSRALSTMSPVRSFWMSSSSMVSMRSRMPFWRTTWSRHRSRLSCDTGALFWCFTYILSMYCGPQHF